MSDLLYQGEAPDLRIITEVVGRGYAVGDALPSEAELARTGHFGRPQLRESLRVLEAFGAVRSRQGARRTWTKFDPNMFGQHLAAVLGADPVSVSELFELRHAFELTHLPQVVASMEREQELRLRNIVADMTAAARRDEGLEIHDERFHRVLFSLTPNRVFEGISAAFWQLHAQLEETCDRNEDRLDVAAMHARLLEAVASRDVRRAVHELDSHFWGVRKRLDEPQFPPV